MFWEEKIEFFIKSKKLTTKDLSIPYTFWSEVFKEIEKNFLIKTDAKYTYQNWESRLKNKHIIDVADYKQRIEIDKKYWLILANGAPTGINLLYDCKGCFVDAITQLHGNNYFVCDKKYQWLITFNKSENNYYLSRLKQ
ncbi:hypothetical protein QQ054_10585 [Oscillatoria amoena NRMC-F 0135]|nr:hypothetical protein [Oscillatoria amoena NRMC-F 0135]